jgi:hypothetical protein
MPRSAAWLHPQQIIEQLHALKNAHTNTRLYQLTDAHRLLLYECLDGYCQMVNEMLDLSCLHERYGIGLIDFDLLVEHFFEDTDFLNPNSAERTSAQRGTLPVTPETEVAYWLAGHHIQRTWR